MLVRHYQAVPPLNPGKGERDSLVEIGPRFALTPIRILSGSFKGETLYNSETYKSPNLKRRELKLEKARRTRGVVAQKEKRRERIQAKGYDLLPENELADVFLP